MALTIQSFYSYAFTINLENREFEKENKQYVNIELGLLAEEPLSHHNSGYGPWLILPVKLEVDDEGDVSYFRYNYK